VHNKIQVNPEKFQVIAAGKKSFDKSPIFQIGTANISCDEVVKLLGVDIDFMLNFQNLENEKKGCCRLHSCINHNVL
jgi:hypothetical protein